MASDLSRSTKCPPLRQARGTRLNTIIEDAHEALYSETTKNCSINKPTSQTPSLKLKTTGLQPPPKSNKLWSPLSTESLSSCSDTEWQCQMQNLDDLYDATDEDSDISDECMSFCSTSTRPTSLVTPITIASTVPSFSHNHYPSLIISLPTAWPSLHDGPKSSPLPPTPPPKIPLSPAALSILSHSVPAAHAPPSLDGSVSSDQVSNINTPATPDLESLPDDDWNAQEVHVRSGSDSDVPQNLNVQSFEANADIKSVEVTIEDPDENWQRGLENLSDQTTPIILHLSSEPMREDTPSEGGLLLPEDALVTLGRIQLDADPWSETLERSDEEMWQIEVLPERSCSTDNATPVSDISGYSFSGLSIPSPGGFFASLGPRARHTWSIPIGGQLPTSAIAENFYNIPFSRTEGEIIEQVVECSQKLVDEQLTAISDPSAPSTAIWIPPEYKIKALDRKIESPVSDGEDGVHEKLGHSLFLEDDERDKNYERELQSKSMASLDRTSGWLAAQASYLAALHESNPINTPDIEDGVPVETAAEETQEIGPKKSVRFAETSPETPRPHLSVLESEHSIYWRGFQFIRQQSNSRDTFLHRNTRFDAIQSVRLGLTNLHMSCLLGNYELVRPERPPYKGPFSQTPHNSVIDSALADKVQFSLIEKEQLVLSQISQSMWTMDALRYLNGGNMVASPVLSRLLRSAASKLSQCSNSSDRVRVLDLGGHASCEWAWQLAYDFPNVNVYTAFTAHQEVNFNIRGPLNHRQVFVPCLWKLPFPDNEFDVISARSLPALLKVKHPAGNDQDEYDLCLKECYRCLRPGGYLEFFVLDAEISHAGPSASAMSIEFASNLKTRGYDPVPTKKFLSRLRKSRFIATKRAWMFLPIGVEPAKPQVPRETPEPRVKSQIDEYEAVHGPVGSTTDIASVTGLFGGWLWEQWLLKLHVEMGQEQQKLFEVIGSVFNEGRKNGAGWTCLTGWAMKPKLKRKGQSGCLGTRNPWSLNF